MESVFFTVISNVVDFLLIAGISYTWRRYKDAKTSYKQERLLREKELECMRAGLQSLLRDRMIDAYNRFYEDKGYMPIYARESFTAVYNAYHNLGENGVMDNIKDKILTLPTTPTEKEEG